MPVIYYNKFRIMEIGKVANVINDPTLYYALDPGEPGMATPARASESIAKVAMHEGGNILRFRKEASEKGGIVVYSYIYLNLKFAGSFLAATAGESRAIIIYPAKKAEKNPAPDLPEIADKPPDFDKINAPGSDEKNDDKNIKNADSSKKGGNLNAAGSNIVSRLDGEIKTLEDEKNRIDAGGNPNIRQNGEKDGYTQDRVREIENRIQYLEQLKQAEKQKEYLESLGKVYSTTMKLIGLNISSLVKGPEGNLVDTVA